MSDLFKKPVVLNDQEIGVGKPAPFFDVLFGFFKKPTTVSGEAYTPDAIAKRMGYEMTTPEKSPHAQIAEELIDIQRLNSKGFRTIDINPNYLTADDAYCLIEPQNIIELMGPQYVNPASGFNEDNDSNIAMPYWRSVELPISGNFLMVEYLPIRNNDMTVNQFQVETEIEQQNIKTDTNDNFEIYSPYHAGNRMLLVNFQDTKDKPLIAKHGDVFKTEFTTVILTFKAFGPKIRITIGYNSTIESKEDRSANMAIAYSPGFGMFTNTYMNAVPFCINDDDITLRNLPHSQTFIDIRGDETFQTDLITNVEKTLGRCLNFAGPNSDLQAQFYTTQYQYSNATDSASCAMGGGSWEENNFAHNGMSVGWITEFSGSFVLSSASATTTAIREFNFALEIVQYSPGGLTVTSVRRLCSDGVTMTFDSTSGYPVYSFTKTFAEPIRFTLQTRQALRIRIYNRIVSLVSDKRIIAKFSVTGYTWGSMVGLGLNSGIQVAPFEIQNKLTENPFPSDNSSQGSPRF